MSLYKENIPSPLLLNGIGEVNVQKITGEDKRIENYERMVGNLFVGHKMDVSKEVESVGGMMVSKPQKITSHNERADGMSDKRNYDCLQR